MNVHDRAAPAQLAVYSGRGSGVGRMGTTSVVDLVIVGAGAAGLAAARRARELELNFNVFEAMDRIGGRAHTVTEPFGVPWDRGCHWLHSASLNPMRELADAYGVRYERQPLPERIWVGDRWATEAEQHAHDAFADRSYEAIIAAGRTGRDIPAASVVDESDPGMPQLRTWVHAETGVGLDEFSTLDAASYRDTDEDWPVVDGYGALVVRHAVGLPVELSTPVARIDWGGQGVRVSTPLGTIDARAVVVTVSTDVLADGRIRFDPALPSWKLEAAVAVPLGRANKVAFAVEGHHLGVEEPTNVVVPLAGGGSMNLRLRPFGRDLADGYLAGPSCRTLEEVGEEAMIEAARDALVGALGTAVSRHIGAVACSRWGAEPSILGAYGAAQPGQFHRRVDLARPVADRVFFAGEATSPDFFATCHGAHLSGISAVDAVMAALGRGAAA